MAVKGESYNISGSDYSRLPGPASSDAMERLLAAAADTGHPNKHDAAAIAVDHADEVDVRSALRHLLGLHMCSLADEGPMVAMRNVEKGDYVRLHGVKCYVAEVDHRGTEGQTVYLRVSYHRPGNKLETFAYSRDVRIPLIARGEGVNH